MGTMEGEMMAIIILYSENLGKIGRYSFQVVFKHSNDDGDEANPI